jgi:hypothetical protein
VTDRIQTNVAVTRTDRDNRADPRKQREIALKVARRMFADMAA